MIPQRTADDKAIAGTNFTGAPVHSVRNHADAGGIDENLVRRAARHYLGVAGDDLDPGVAGGLRHRVHDTQQRFSRQSLFQNESTGEVTRQRPAHRQIVDRTAHRQFADVAAGKLDRVNHVAVGGKRQPVALLAQRRQRQTRLIFALRQQRVVKRLQKQPFDQLLHRLPAAAVRQGNLFRQ